MSTESRPLAMIVRQLPYQQRYARAQLDVALAAATLEIPLKVFFMGDGIWQLAESRATAAAGLPRGLKGWKALSSMTQVEFFVENGKLEKLTGLDVKLLVAVEGLNPEAMADEWRDCHQVMSL